MAFSSTVSALEQSKLAALAGCHAAVSMSVAKVAMRREFLIIGSSSKT
jgi:hypothetical protein